MGTFQFKKPKMLLQPLVGPLGTYVSLENEYNFILKYKM